MRWCCQPFCRQIVRLTCSTAYPRDTDPAGAVSLRAGPDMTTSDSPVQRASEAFVAEFARWRIERGMSKKQLAAAMGFDPSYVSHVEARRHRPTEDFARRAEAILQSRRRDLAAVPGVRRAARTARSRVGPPGRDPPVPDQWLPPGTRARRRAGDSPQLTYVDGEYRCMVRRELYNAGTEPVTRYLVRIAVDRYPDDPGALQPPPPRPPAVAGPSWRLGASCGGRADATGGPRHDRDAFKEVWLLFENDAAALPALPGRADHHRVRVHVGAEKWGHWFQRAVRLPTRQLAVELDFPARMRPVVWGVETSLSAEEGPLRTPITRSVRRRRPGGLRLAHRAARRCTPATGWSGASGAPGPRGRWSSRTTGGAPVRAAGPSDAHARGSA